METSYRPDYHDEVACMADADQKTVNSALVIAGWLTDAIFSKRIGEKMGMEFLPQHLMGQDVREYLRYNGISGQMLCCSWGDFTVDPNSLLLDKVFSTRPPNRYGASPNNDIFRLSGNTWSCIFQVKAVSWSDVSEQPKPFMGLYYNQGMENAKIYGNLDDFQNEMLMYKLMGYHLKEE